MMDMKDWISFFFGIVIIALGLVPILETYTAINFGLSGFLEQGWFVAALPFIVAIAGFYLLIESVREITNSSSVGWVSFWIGAILMTVGVGAVLGSRGIGPEWFNLPFLTGATGILVYRLIFMVEGFFLMIATFAMEI
ncbi:hypothetical protein ACFLZ7_01845 [Nanoarchaeota archaeon]